MTRGHAPAQKRTVLRHWWTARLGRQRSDQTCVIVGGWREAPALWHDCPSAHGVIVDGDGSEVVFSIRRRAGVTDKEFDADAQAVTADLARLKAIMEAP